MYPASPVPVRFLSRPSRFLAEVVPGEAERPVAAHVPNPGRMEELLVPGETVGYAIPRSGAARRTSFDLVSVRHGRALVSVDAGLANRLVRSWLVGGDGSHWRAEVRYRDCRFDFARVGRDGELRELLEVKSSNLRVGRTALFPDAPTRRGAHHLRTLAAAARGGILAHAWFVVQRADVAEFAPNRELDPEFGAAFDLAWETGVRFRALRLRVRPSGAVPVGWVPVRRQFAPKRI